MQEKGEAEFGEKQCPRHSRSFCVNNRNAYPPTSEHTGMRSSNRRFLLLVSCLLALVVVVGSYLLFGELLENHDQFPLVKAPPDREKYRNTLNNGLDYLARNQCQDGHWEGDDGKHPVAMTALVGMAFLSVGQFNIERSGGEMDQGENTRKYLLNIVKAVDWLIAKRELTE